MPGRCERTSGPGRFLENRVKWRELALPAQAPEVSSGGDSPAFRTGQREQSQRLLREWLRRIRDPTAGTGLAGQSFEDLRSHDGGQTGSECLDHFILNA